MKEKKVVISPNNHSRKVSDHVENVDKWLDMKGAWKIIWKSKAKDFTLKIFGFFPLFFFLK